MILIAERDQNVRELQKYFLGQAGFDVWFVDDGAAALAKAQVASPVLVVTEILIPKIDGLSLCRRLREDPATRAIPVIVFSILAAAARASDAGANAFLRKPLVESTFLATVENVIAAQPRVLMEQQWISK
ncbi:MAG TPA: response regulator [Longimicrobiales bacterium]|nr:response regulator [Longimicrobiales bacterium]